MTMVGGICAVWKGSDNNSVFLKRSGLMKCMIKIKIEMENKIIVKNT